MRLIRWLASNLPGRMEMDPTANATTSVTDVMVMATPDWDSARPKRSANGFCCKGILPLFRLNDRGRQRIRSEHKKYNCSNFTTYRNVVTITLHDPLRLPKS